MQIQSEIDCALYLSSLQLFTHSIVLIILLFVCYTFISKLQAYSALVAHLQIVLVNNVICKA